MRDGSQVVLTCQCGARLEVRSFYSVDVVAQVNAFYNAHEVCRDIYDTLTASRTGRHREEGRDGN